MKKLNTHAVYTFALRINPLTTLEYPEEGEMTLKDLFWTLIRAEVSLRGQLEPAQGFFSSSLKRSAGALMRAIYDVGLNSERAFDTDLSLPVPRFKFNVLVTKAKEFETVLANELPGLATYIVFQKGIYSTDELISNADTHILEKFRAVLSPKAAQDIQQGGRCLAFEVATASAFHMWRAVESVMNSYYQALTGKTFADANITQTWYQYIEALKKANAENKITSFLDHIREEYRNPIAHPEELLELDEAFGLFGTALSAIGQMLRPILEIKEVKEAKEKAEKEAKEAKEREEAERQAREKAILEGLGGQAAAGGAA